MPNTETGLVAGDVVTIGSGKVIWEVTEVSNLDGPMMRIWPMDRDDDREGRWQYPENLVKVEPANVGNVIGAHTDNGYGYCKGCRVAMAKAADTAECDNAWAA